MFRPVDRKNSLQLNVCPKLQAAQVKQGMSYIVLMIDLLRAVNGF